MQEKRRKKMNKPKLFFEAAAKAHPKIKHHEDGVDYPSGNRISFFYDKDYGQIIQALNTQIDFPILQLNPKRGYFSESGINFDEFATHRVEVLYLVDSHDDHQAIDAAYSIAEEIAKDILLLIKDEMEAKGYCSLLGNVMLNTVQYEYIGPVADRLYGYGFSVIASNEGINLITFDKDTVFPNFDSYADNNS
jgi:hypothetical protein